ncbi:MAG: hypothetical protein HN521_07310, partial [Candidatus Latescibacteria bacterium]|nr:hypothetical protein [Candidatus Latescibacterota bacterium]
MKNKMFKYQNSESFFHGVDLVFELFSAPIPEEINGTKIKESYDLFQMSRHQMGGLLFFFPTEDTVEVDCDGIEEIVRRDDFIDYQLLTLPTSDLYYLLDKIDFDGEAFFDIEIENEKDEYYDPITWLSPIETSSKEQGIEFIERMRTEDPDRFCGAVREGMYCEYNGVTRWWETTIGDNFRERVSRYSDWDVPIMIVWQGKFTVYFDGESPYL